MREFELIIDEALKKGLSPEINLPFNSPFLYQVLGFRCGRAGLEPYIISASPVPYTVDMHYIWPFPQYVTGEKFNLLVVRDTISDSDFIYSINDSHTTASLIATIDLSYGQGWLVEVADFGEYVFMTNGVAMIFWDVLHSDWDITTGTTIVPLLGTVCNLKGQLVGGGIRSTWFDCDEKFYVWSRIGSADLTPSEDNEAGYRRCPYGGEVYHVRRLGDNVVGYSSKGITLLKPVGNPPTFGFIELSDVGLINRGAVNGNLLRQVYVGEDFILREITNEGIKELGYQWLMQLLSSEDIIVSFDSAKRDFYIGNSSKTFLLSPYGMTEILQHPSAVWNRDKQTYLVPDEEDTVDPLITTWPIDFEYGGQKTNQVVEMSGGGYEDALAAVDYLNNGSWITSNYSLINKEGIATVVVSSNAFRFKIKFPVLNNDFRISHIKSRYKMTDLRGIRGVYAPPIRGQA